MNRNKQTKNYTKTTKIVDRPLANLTKMRTEKTKSVKSEMEKGDKTNTMEIQGMIKDYFEQPIFQ
jgi:hypothetical protein